MTPEGRIDRIERITKLFARAGRRARTDLRSQEEKINILINLHIENEERFARNEERIAKNEERFARTDQMIRENQARTDEKFIELVASQTDSNRRLDSLVASQADSNRRLDSLIEIIRNERNGTS